MLRAVVVVMLVLMLGCGSKSAPPPAAPVENASEPPPAPKPAPAPASQPSSNAGACAAYVGMLQRFMVCPNFPQQSRASVQQAMPQMQQMLATLATMKPDERKASEDACAQAVTALRQGAMQMGCPI